MTETRLVRTRKGRKIKTFCTKRKKTLDNVVWSVTRFVKCNGMN